MTGLIHHKNIFRYRPNRLVLGGSQVIFGVVPLLLILLLVLNLNRVVVIGEVHELHLVLWVPPIDRATFHILLDDRRVRLQHFGALSGVLDLGYINTFTFLSARLLVLLLHLVVHKLLSLRVSESFQQVWVIAVNCYILGILQNVFLSVLTRSFRRVLFQVFVRI